MIRRLFLAVAFLPLIGCALADPAKRVSDLSLPAGASIDIFAEVPGARSLAVVPELGAVLVGTRGSRVYAVEYGNGGARAGTVRVLRDDLKVANGIAWKDGALYVAEQHRIVRFRGGDLAALAAAPAELLFDRLPDEGHHGWRYAAFGPDGLLYVSVGAPCNVCGLDGLEGTIIRLDPDDGAPEIYAHGVRNPVGLDFQPGGGDLYFTDNGADWMGDDSPPDELNHAPRSGGHFGFPWYGGGSDRTPAFRGNDPPADVRFPAVQFGAHVAALGIHFYRGRQFPDDLRGDALVAQHGSWNRTVPVGYRIVRVRFDDSGRATGHAPFIEGWLDDNGDSWGRPVDLAELPDGSLLVSDDSAGVLYRVTYAR